MMQIASEVELALKERRPVVALESTLIAHGLPRPTNLETARRAEEAVRSQCAVPATIAILGGVPTIGLSKEQLQCFANADGILKASRRDLGAAIALKRDAATTVSATMAFAHRTGIRVFATGGIGGVHRENSFDVSADLTELSRTPVLVVCAGAKSILDLPKSLEALETLGVPVIGYRTDRFPAFYVRSSAGAVSCRVETAAEAAAVFSAHVDQGGAGALLVQPCPESVAIDENEFEVALSQAEKLANEAGVSGPAITPFLLARLAELTQGRTLTANKELIVANAALAAQVAAAMAVCC